MIEADEADQQHVEDVYEEAQAGLFDRDRETRRMLDGTPLSAGPSLRATGTPPGGAPSTGGSPGDGPPRMARPTAQTMLRRQASGAETTSEGTSADADDVLQTAQLMGGWVKCGQWNSPCSSKMGGCSCSMSGRVVTVPNWLPVALPPVLQTASRWWVPALLLGW